MRVHCSQSSRVPAMLPMLLALSSYAPAQTPHPVLKTLYTFTGGNDGSMPSAGVIVTSGVFYGATLYGGPPGYGVVYSLTAPATPGAPWTETTLYSFSGGADGAYPAGPVTLAGGTLYGTTGGPGSLNTTGAVYSLTPPASRGGAWREANLYSFPNRGDGSNPQSALSIGSGPGGHLILYGTTSSGGGCPSSLWGCGTLFSLRPPAGLQGAWAERVIHRFGRFNGQPLADGLYPNGAVMGENGALYGAASEGGNHGYGAVYSFTPSGSGQPAWMETIIHDFAGSASGDGAYPSGGVAIGTDGTLYGTTQFGGASGAGTVFSLAPPPSPAGAWTETVLYSFAGGSDGGEPSAGVVIGPGGVLYGSTAQGGLSNSLCDLNCGILFSLSPPASPGAAWTKTTIYRFTGGSDGFGPSGSLLVAGGLLIGVTQFGGSCTTSGAGCGTVFALAP